ncbi:hypothetical protein ACFLXV_01995 [Chloroflexota bacterium]
MILSYVIAGIESKGNMQRIGKSRLGWIEEACIRLLDSSGGVIEDWPGLKVELHKKRHRRYSLKSDVTSKVQGRAPSLPELEEAWFGLESKGFVSLEYEKLNLKRISRQASVTAGRPDSAILSDVESNRLNLAFDILSCLFILPGAFANSIFGPFSLAFALAITGSKRKWNVLRMTGVIFGSVLAVAFLYNAIR